MIDQLKDTLSRIGIIGGGQLSLMLVDAAIGLGLKVVILASNDDEPAPQKYRKTHSVPDVEFILGSSGDIQVLESFLSQVQTVVFENEFLDCELLQKAAQGKAVQFIPSLTVLQLFQDKLLQKKLLTQAKVPTSEYQELGLPAQITRTQIQKICDQWEGACVLKWSRMGYDGKGVLVVSGECLDWEKIEGFLQSAGQKNSLIYAERKIDFKRELAIIAAHSVKGDLQVYPLVVSEQVAGICSLVYGPAQSVGVSKNLEELAGLYAKGVAEQGQLFGVFALEFFETQEGVLLVNEIAPRVHNSGHYTMNVARMTDQFENHLRAVLGRSLGPTSSSGAFAMHNLLGPDVSLSAQKQTIPMPVVSARTHLHWYGKSEVRLNRKLGHLNGYVENISNLGELIVELKASVSRWKERLGK